MIKMQAKIFPHIRYPLETWVFTHFSSHPVRCGSFTRNGGAGVSPYDSLNVGDTVGDDQSIVEENKKRIQEALQVNKMAEMHQVHGKEVLSIDAPGTYTCDGLLTKEPDLLLLVRHADCQPALFVDPVQKVVGAVHAGWRGLTLNIYREAIQKMQRDFGSNPADILVGIGPSLGKKHAEFIHFKEEFPSHLHHFFDETSHVSLREIASFQLKEAGVQEKNIDICPECTYALPEKYFSYRREKCTGRMGTAIALNSSSIV